VISGSYDDVSGFPADVWRSTDGKGWSRTALDTSFHARAGHTSVVYDSNIYSLGGYWEPAGETSFRSDVIFSFDGFEWTEAINSAEFPNRTYHTSVVYNDAIWVMGGMDDTEVFGDVWISLK